MPARTGESIWVPFVASIPMRQPQAGRGARQAVQRHRNAAGIEDQRDKTAISQGGRVAEAKSGRCGAPLLPLPGVKAQQLLFKTVKSLPRPVVVPLIFGGIGKPHAVFQKLEHAQIVQGMDFARNRQRQRALASDAVDVVASRAEPAAFEPNLLAPPEAAPNPIFNTPPDRT